ncbi:hypothetical protein Tco_0504399, partial [Tanacetum coccineum]
VPDEENVTSKEKVILEWGSEQESEYLEEDQSEDEEVDWIYSEEDDEMEKLLMRPRQMLKRLKK